MGSWQPEYTDVDPSQERLAEMVLKLEREVYRTKRPRQLAKRDLSLRVGEPIDVSRIQRLFGSQRALKTIEDFTEFEQRAAYLDGDPVSAAAKGINPLERGSQVHFMAELQELLAFPPAPLGVDGKLDTRKFAANSAEMRGQSLFFGKAQCATCHPAPDYTDNTMHDLQVERFYKPQTINGLVATSQGPIKTFPLRGIKESPPYFHDGRLLTLEDTIEFFNLVLELKLSTEEKTALVAFMRQL
jgi:cytochrome c peroxidase